MKKNQNKIMGIRKLIALQLLLAFSLFAVAQNGKIKGLVTDAKTGERLVGATVMLQGTGYGSITDFDGNYLIGNIAPGMYTIRCSFISYETKLAKDITIAAGQELEFNFDLGESTFEIGGVDVVAKVNRQSESILLIEQKNSVLATQAIGAQEISRKGVGDAEGAVTKVSGVSKQEGVKNVFVRGLGDRFNSTSLNGFPVPSEDPEYKNISLDFFASDMIGSVGVNKVFGPGMTGDVGGAEINIRSKELAGDSEFGLDASVGANTQTVAVDFLKPDGVGVPGYSLKAQKPLDLTNYLFQNSLDPSKQNVQLNQSFSASGGKKLLIGSSRNPFDIFVLGMYSTDFSYVNGVVRNTTTTGTVFQDQDYGKYSQNTSHMAMINADYHFEKHRISYSGTYIHTNVQSVGDYVGLNSVYEDAADFRGFLRRQQVNDNSLIVNQLLSEWKLSDRFSLDAGVSLNLIAGNEPDRRTNYLSAQDNGTYRLTKGTGRQQRYFSGMNETDFNVKVGAGYKLTNEAGNSSAVNFGYSGRLVKRTFDAVEYDQQIVNQAEFSLENIRLDEFFNQVNLSAGNFILDRNRDEYTVGKWVNSGYGEVVYSLNNRLTGVAGIRLDNVNMNVDYNVNRGGTQGKTKIAGFYFLPSLNLKYDLTGKSSFRFGASRTYTLPQAKEISPFRYVDVSFKSQGNPGLKSSVNYNIDLKWDYYLSSDELFSVTGFGKYIQDPISRVEKASAGGFLTYDNIADRATVAGIELEFRKNIIKQTTEGGRQSKLSAGVNSSYILTDVKLRDANFTNRKSQLEGAAPVIVNADLSHNVSNAGFSFTNSLILNYFSDRVYTIGTQGYQDIVEKGIPTLDFVSSARLNKHWQLSLKAKNLLSPSLKLSREPNDAAGRAIVLSDYKKGIFISLGISYNL
ncbi:MAG: carboxypeptidase-like regulatory domain-containing protein [Prolixibacteraceae bacterium]|nr:carboxypeptidase-like regulatory domain-containing protein [Prolixibacteraceae bacterium]